MEHECCFNGEEKCLYCGLDIDKFWEKEVKKMKERMGKQWAEKQ